MDSGAGPRGYVRLPLRPASSSNGIRLLEPGRECERRRQRSSRLPVVLILLLTAIPCLAVDSPRHAGRLAISARKSAFFASPPRRPAHRRSAVYSCLRFPFRPGHRRRTLLAPSRRSLVIAAARAALSPVDEQFYALAGLHGSLLMLPLVFDRNGGAPRCRFLAFAARDRPTPFWMIRGYAIAWAGTQAMLSCPGADLCIQRARQGLLMGLLDSEPRRSVGSSAYGRCGRPSHPHRDRMQA